MLILEEDDEIKTRSHQFKYWLQKEKLEEISNFLKEGKTQEQLIKKLNISNATFYAWKEKSEKFRKVVEEGLYSVQDAIYDLRQAMKGYFVTETQTDYLGRETKKTRYIPPSVTAIMFYLKHKDPENWGDKEKEFLNHDFIPVVIKNDFKN